jgi:Uma2 family endonuclease
MAAQVTHWQFTVGDYARMRETGIFSEDDRVELIDGEVRPMTPIGPLHAAIVNRLTRLLGQYLGTTAIVSVQNPVRLSNYSEPQPDVMVLRPRQDFYAKAHPQPEDVWILIEVADTTVAYDRDEKLPRYAAAGVPEVWLIDVSRQAIEQYSEPGQDRYHAMHLVERDQTLQAKTVPGLRLAVASLFD